MSDLVERLREQITSDHTRGCQGRCYSCDCGYDLATEGLLEQAATALEAKDKEIDALRERVKELEPDVTRWKDEHACSEISFQRALARAETAERRVAKLEGMLSPESDHPTRNVGLLYQQARAEKARAALKACVAEMREDRKVGSEPMGEAERAARAVIEEMGK